MPRILDNLPVLEKLAKNCPFGLMTDIDGTISSTSTNPLKVSIPEIHRRYLVLLSRRLSLVAVVSGRQATEVREMVDGDRVLCIGHYGMEWWRGDRAELHPDAIPYVPAIRAVAKELEALRSMEGIVVQDKEATISVHYRLSPQPQSAREEIMRLLEKSPHAKSLRIVEEKMVIGIVPPVAVDKGTAVASLIQQYQLRGALYLGDDTADVPAFRAIQEASRQSDFKGLAIAVVNEETAPEVVNVADFTLDGVEESELLLRWLVKNTPAH